MCKGRHVSALAGAIAALAPAQAPAATAPPSPPLSARLQAALLRSRELWATVDICNPADQPYTVGIRASMPGDGRSRDRLYMEFRLQYLSSDRKSWHDLAKSRSGFVGVGSGAFGRESGTSVEFVAGQAASTMRGVVEFQWRRGKSVLLSVQRPTSAPHHSGSGADPAGFSAATCLLG
jgi:hypothetical protein